MSAATTLPADVPTHPLVRIAADLSLIAWERMTAWRGSLGADLDSSVVDTKTSPNDLVTLADAEIEALVRGYLSVVRPGDRMVGEEGAEALDPVTVFEPDVLRRLSCFDPVAGRLAEVADGDLAEAVGAGGDAVVDAGRAAVVDGGAPGAPIRLEWHVDPIDGTVNFVRGIEHFAFSVGVCRGREGDAAAGGDAAADDDSAAEREPTASPDPGGWILGLVASPGLDATWLAIAGHGAYRIAGRLFDRMPEPGADAPAGVTATRLAGTPAGLSGRLLATGFAYRGDDRARQLSKLHDLMDGYDDIRRCGSAAIDLCMVAEGRVTCYAERGLGIYDYAGGALIAEEAGAAVHRGGSGGPTVAADSAEERHRLLAAL